MPSQLIIIVGFLSTPVSLGEFFASHLSRRLPDEQSRADFAYNFVSSLELYLLDPDCELFYRILLNEVDEHAFYHQKDMVAECIRSLIKFISDRAFNI